MNSAWKQYTPPHVAASLTVLLGWHTSHGWCDHARECRDAVREAYGSPGVGRIHALHQTAPTARELTAPYPRNINPHIGGGFVHRIVTAYEACMLTEASAGTDVRQRGRPIPL
jgi:hypothetical protein